MSKHINKNMNKHYQKYKEIKKRTTKRNYQKRQIWLNNFLSERSCIHCGESETMCLSFHPHDAKVRSLSRRVGINENSREVVQKYIDNSKILCYNCKIKLDNDLIELL